MIIGFGFGDPLTSLLMLLLTSIGSYMLFKALRQAKNSKENPHDDENKREQLKRYYLTQREHAREMMREFDLTDEEIERRIEEDLRK